MAQRDQFLLGVLGADFMQLQTTDGIYLKDIIDEDIVESLAEYNARELALTRLFSYKFDDSYSIDKLMYTSDEFSEIGEIETPRDKKGVEVWRLPCPIRRFGSLTKITYEQLAKMSSDDIRNFHNGKLIADQKNTVKTMFEAMCLKTPIARVDALDGKATTAKAFWNDESGMDTPRTNGQITFDGDHQHYLAVATADNLGTNGSELDTLLATITEHEGYGGALPILWARTGATLNLIKNESTNFRAVNDVAALLGMVNPDYNKTGITQALVHTAKTLGWNVRVVGTWKDAIVTETPDIPADYILATAYMGENNSGAPLQWREHPAFKGLKMVSPTGQNPIIGQDAQYRRYLGLAVRNRSAGAVLYVGGTSWVEPSFS